ncbi:hypothetical protein [Sporomusa malonica]|nr:hypothetical protein [Sporomusa malonica]
MKAINNPANVGKRNCLPFWGCSQTRLLLKNSGERPGMTKPPV